MHWFERQRTHKFTNHWVLKIIEVYQLPTPTPSEIPNLQQPGDFTWRSNNGRQQSIFSKIKIHHLDIYTVYNWVIWGIDICKPFLHTSCLHIATVHCNKRSRSWWNLTLTEARALPALFVQPTCSWWKDHGSNTDLQVMGWNRANGERFWSNHFRCQGYHGYQYISCTMVKVCIKWPHKTHRVCIVSFRFSSMLILDIAHVPFCR